MAYLSTITKFFNVEKSFSGTMMMVLMLVVTTGITGARFCMLTKLSGSLWIGMAEHFFNNTIINMLHVSTESVMGDLQVIRITIAQTVSFIIVLFILLKGKFHRKLTYR